MPQNNHAVPQLKHDPEIETMTSLTASRDVAKVQAVILNKYKFVASPAFCQDFIIFIEALTDGQQRA